MKKNSANSRLDFARQNNKFAAAALLKDDKIQDYIKNRPIVNDVKIIDDEKPKVVAHDEEIFDAVCVCNRKAQIIECQKCKMLFYGRISEKCHEHPNVTYLLDFFYCPSCAGPKENLRIKALDTRLQY